jgi:hypothetical protein
MPNPTKRFKLRGKFPETCINVSFVEIRKKGQIPDL